MGFEKKIAVYEDDENMEISLTWYSPMAFFFLFFTLAWNAFLVLWYSIAIGGDAPLIMSLFPIIHVGVGVYLAYYTFCLFFNKTFIHITGGHLHVLHQPIPWIKGNKKFDISEFDQIYVKEKVSTNKEGNTNYSYSLRARLKNNKDVVLLNLPNLESHEAQSIEEQIEKHLGIIDAPVKGEYGVQSGASKKPGPRKVGQTFSDPNLQKLYFGKPNTNFKLEGINYKLASIDQFDWKDGNSDKLLQFLDPNQNEKMIFLQQNRALLQVFEEEKLSAGSILRIKFNPEKPTPVIFLNEQYFELQKQIDGACFSQSQTNAVQVRHWIYLNKEKTEQIRVQDLDGNLSLQLGTRLNPSEIMDTLDLNEPRPLDLKLPSTDLSEEDLV